MTKQQQDLPAAPLVGILWNCLNNSALRKFNILLFLCTLASPMSVPIFKVVMTSQFTAIFFRWHSFHLLLFNYKSNLDNMTMLGKIFQLTNSSIMQTQLKIFIIHTIYFFDITFLKSGLYNPKITLCACSRRSPNARVPPKKSLSSLKVADI